MIPPVSNPLSDACLALRRLYGDGEREVMILLKDSDGSLQAYRIDAIGHIHRLRGCQKSIDAGTVQTN